MTPAAIALAALCGVLAVVALLMWVSVRGEKDHNEAILSLYRKKIDELQEARETLIARNTQSIERIDADSALIAEAHALLHDERHKGKLDNQKQWQAARAEWAGKVNAR